MAFAPSYSGQITRDRTRCISSEDGLTSPIGHRAACGDEIDVAAHHRFGRFGFAYDPNQLWTYTGPQTRMTGHSLNRIYFPHWSLVVGSLVLRAVLAWRRWRSRNASAQGICSRCGYDLRAT